MLTNNYELLGENIGFDLPYKKDGNGNYKLLPNTKFIGGKNCLRDLANSKIKIGFVYFIRIKNTNKCKIGVSINPKRRLSDISSIIPFDIEILAVNKILNPYNIEQKIINEYKSKLIKNEWFDFDIMNIKDIVIYLHNIQFNEQATN